MIRFGVNPTDNHLKHSESKRQRAGSKRTKRANLCRNVQLLCRQFGRHGNVTSSSEFHRTAQIINIRNRLLNTKLTVIYRLIDKSLTEHLWFVFFARNPTIAHQQSIKEPSEGLNVRVFQTQARCGGVSVVPHSFCLGIYCMLSDIPAFV